MRASKYQVVLIATNAACLCALLLAGTCLDASLDLDHLVIDKVRIVTSEGITQSANAIQRVNRLVVDQPLLPGLPRGLLATRTITISLIRERLDGIDARAFPSDLVIAIPATAVESWTDSKLRRVLRHELMHLALGAALGYAHVPAWFSEGFAEWGSESLSCEAEARLRLDAVIYGGQSPNIPQLSVKIRNHIDRLGYDYLQTFFEFLDGRPGHLVSSGRMVESVREHGVVAGLEKAFRANLRSLEGEWHGYLRRRFGSFPSGFTCPPSVID